MYKVKNKSDKDFSFEGFSLKAGETSGSLSVEHYQRLLALYLHDPLEPIVEKVIEQPIPVVQAPVVEASSEPSVAPPIPSESPVPLAKPKGRPKKVVLK